MTADGNWQHISIPVDPTWGPIGALAFKKWFSPETTGTLSFWIDNIEFIPASSEPEPPTLSIAPAKKGLNLFLSQAGQQYQREGIRSLAADGLFFVGNAQPVTYSITIAEAPPAGTFQTHIVLAPDAPLTENNPDYERLHTILLDIRSTAAGGSATFRYKVNQARGNSQMYNTAEGQLGTLNATSLVGTWSMTLQSDNQVTLNGPGGATMNLTIPAENAALFTGSSMGTYFGIQPNDFANIGKHAVISAIKITEGETVVVDETFTAPDLNTEIWSLNADDGAKAMRIVTQDAAYWLSWTLPDADFALRMKTDLNGAEITPTLTPFLNGVSRAIFVDPATLGETAPDAAFFYLVKPTAP